MGICPEYFIKSILYRIKDIGGCKKQYHKAYHSDAGPVIYNTGKVIIDETVYYGDPFFHEREDIGMYIKPVYYYTGKWYEDKQCRKNGGDEKSKRMWSCNGPETNVDGYGRL